jgi:hypothetical protein
MLSAEAIMEILDTPEPELIQFLAGVQTLLELRWRGPGYADPHDLLQDMARLGVGKSDWANYLLYATWRRARRRSIEPRATLATYREQVRLREREISTYNRSHPGVLDILGVEATYLPYAIRYKRQSKELEARQEATVELTANILRAPTAFVLVEAQGSASSDETDREQLSTSRAGDAVSRLRSRGVPCRFTTLGLGDRFPIPDPPICPEGLPWQKKVAVDRGAPCVDRGDPSVVPYPEKDRRVDLIILRRKWRLPRE